jgi:hypothetical protein
MATLTTALNTAFTPAAGNFRVQCSGGSVELQSRGTSGAAWVRVGQMSPGVVMLVENPVAGVDFRFVPDGSSTPTVQADQ